MNKLLGLVNNIVKWLDVASMLSHWFTKIEKIKRIEINIRYCFNDLIREIARIASIAVEPMKEKENGWWILVLKCMIVVQLVLLIVECILKRILLSINYRKSCFLGSIQHFFKEFRSFINRDCLELFLEILEEIAGHINYYNINRWKKFGYFKT
jgi:hypothetical protein